ncbi:hypothetical protein V5O48_010371 [Marasmius crinis-equi]|uniref:Uncharacterized protein n=1 Tax=Marasmius crinis-equi TaxID=585013 RepID=A0ABR3F8I0_9AGAR
MNKLVVLPYTPLLNRSILHSPRQSLPLLPWLRHPSRLLPRPIPPFPFLGIRYRLASHPRALQQLFGCDPFNADVQPYGVHGLQYAQQVITISEDGKNALANGDGAVGDPASLGVAALMFGRSILMYREAADRQLNFVVNEAPGYWNGAISHRVEGPELWADFTYMAPPSIAYYGVITNNLSLLQQSVDQCRLYRQILSERVGGKSSNVAAERISQVADPE